MSDLPKQLCPSCNEPSEVRARILAGTSKTGLRYLKLPCGKRDSDTGNLCGRKVGHDGRCCPCCDDCAQAGRRAPFGQLPLPLGEPRPLSLLDLIDKAKT